MRPDATDRKILDLLSRGHVGNSAIARRIGVSEGTVRQRLKKLRSAGIVKIRGVIDPEKLADRQLAYVAASVSETRYLDRTARAVAKLDHVLSVSIVSGVHDLIIEVLVDSNKGLIAFLTDRLSTVEHLVRTETFLILRSYKKYV